MSTLNNNNQVVDNSDDELIILLIQLKLLDYEVADLLASLDEVLAREIREERKRHRKLPRKKERSTWVRFAASIPSDHFRRMFRMKLPAFTLLCKTVEQAVGEEVFRSEAYLRETMDDYELALEDKTVPPICGEVKIATCLRMMAGGSYLDLVPLFGLSKSHLYQVFDDFLDWILMTFEFPLVKWLREDQWQELEKRADNFAERSEGVFYGPFAANDGLAVRVRCPTEEDVSDPGNYWCRKGFYALNVQGMCDLSKRFIWAYPTSKGSTHDSAAFSAARLYDLLIEKSNEFLKRGIFIAGDSAYSLTPFMITPYDSTEMKEDVDGAMDSFNYHLSKCRIFIECAFGELIMRWGIFWRTLLFSLKKCAKVIQVGMLLHNFIIDCREADDKDDEEFFKNFDIEMDRHQERLTQTTAEIPRPLATDNNEPRPRGRVSHDEMKLRDQGGEVRHRLTIKLATYGMKRPLQHDMKYNKHGHIYFTS
jgi:DDE superfamily endonuclease